MEALILLLIGVVGVAGVGLVAWLLDRERHRQDHFRRTYRAHFPREVPHDAVLNFVRALSGLPVPRPFEPAHTVVFDTYADEDGIKHYLSIPGHVVADVEGLFRAHIVGGSLVAADDDPVVSTKWEVVNELKATSGHVPLRIGSPEAVAATMLSGFTLLEPGHAALMQWVILPTHPRSAPKPNKTNWPWPDPHTEKSKAKYAEPLFLCVPRFAAKGQHSSTLVRRLYTGLASTHVHGMRFARRLASAGGILRRIQHRSGMLLFPCVLNALELSALLGYPIGEPNVPGLPMSKARHLAPSTLIAKQGLVLGASNYPGLDRPLAIEPAALMQHLWIVGPTGSGKSALLHGLTTQMMQSGMGLVLIEPKGDLARDVLYSVPPERTGDVIWFDPTDTERPIGLNVLAGPDPERTTAHIVALFKNLYGDSWGPRLEQILKYSVYTAAANGLTLYDVKQLLVNPEFRAPMVRRMKAHDFDTYQFWHNLEKGPDNAIDSVVNKLDAFVGSKAIRNIVGQRSGLDMEQVVRQRKILLVPLPAATLGEANASMLGSLLLDQLWTQARLRPEDQRYPMACIMDEFQTFMHMNVAMEEAFAMARSYRLGLVVANQHTGQLTNSVLTEVKNNARSKVAFATSIDDGRKLADHFSPMSADDLQFLGQYEVALKLMTNAGAAPTATARTFPPPIPTGAAEPAWRASREAYGRPVEDIEREFVERHRIADDNRKRPAIGRVREP